jgi:hypothetical protein
MQAIQGQDASTDEVKTEYQRIQKKIPVEARFFSPFQSGPFSYNE